MSETAAVTDYREDITGAMLAHRHDLREALAGVDPETGEERDSLELLDELILSVEVWRKDSDRSSRIVDITLTVGGPTVWVHVDQNDRVTYHHSWGKHGDADRHHLELVGTDAEPFRQVAEFYAGDWS